MKKFIFLLMTTVSLLLSMNARATSDTLMIVRMVEGGSFIYTLNNVKQLYYRYEDGDESVFSCVMGRDWSVVDDYLSIKDGRSYNYLQLNDGMSENVEISFNGSTFMSASENDHGVSFKNGNSAVIKQISDMMFEYATSTGYNGTISVDHELGDESAAYNVTVTRKPSALMCVKMADNTVKEFNVGMVKEVVCIVCGVSVNGNAGNYTYVDLGLESGLKWSSYNVGATKPAEYGDYFAWGETTPKIDNTYKWSDDQGFTKYNTSSRLGVVDDKEELEPEDDAATANWGNAWRMPTRSEIYEMESGCSWEWISDFNGSGVAGMFGISESNGNTIFLPAAGKKETELIIGGEKQTVRNAGSVGYYWTSQLYVGRDLACNATAWYSFFDYENEDNFDGFYEGRSTGMSVRAVFSGKKTYTVNFYGFDSTLISTQAVEEGTSASKVVVPVIDGYYLSGWSDSSFVNVTKNMDIYAKYTKKEEGIPGVNVSGKVGNYTYVDLGLSVKWATCNVGATLPTEYGDYFAWGETEPKLDYSWSTCKWTTDGGKTFTKYNNYSDFGTVDSLTVLEPVDDAATANWGSAWRMPTLDEIKELIDGCDWKWVEGFKGWGIYGQLGTSKVNGNTIFLPAAGLRYGTDLDIVGGHGYYWSSSLNEDFSNDAYYLYFNDGYVVWGYGYRYNGRSVRAVTEH